MKYLNKNIILLFLLFSLYSCDPIVRFPCTFEKSLSDVLKVANSVDTIEISMSYLDLRNFYNLYVKVPSNYSVNKESLSVVPYSLFPNRFKKIAADSVTIDGGRMKKWKFTLWKEREREDSRIKPIYQMDLVMSGLIVKDGKSIINDTITVYPYLKNPLYSIKETKRADKLLKLAEKKIDGFNRESVSVSYAVYKIMPWKGSSFPEFHSVPTFLQINYSLDYVHIKLESVVARINNDVWKLQYAKDSKEGVLFDINDNEDCLLFEYLDSIKPDRVYSLFGQSNCILIEKGFRRYPIKRNGLLYQTCELSDLFNSVEDFNQVVHRFTSDVAN